MSTKPDWLYCESCGQPLPTQPIPGTKAYHVPIEGDREGCRSEGARRRLTLPRFVKAATKRA